MPLKYRTMDGPYSKRFKTKLDDKGGCTKPVSVSYSYVLETDTKPNCKKITIFK